MHTPALEHLRLSINSHHTLSYHRNSTKLGF